MISGDSVRGMRLGERCRGCFVCHPCHAPRLLGHEREGIASYKRRSCLPAIWWLPGKETLRRESGFDEIGDERTDVARAVISRFFANQIALDAVGKVLR